MGVFGKSIQAMKDAIDLLMNDDDLYASITYKRWDSQAFDDTKGHVVNVFTDFTLDAIRLRHNARSAATASSEVQVGDYVYVMRYADMPTGMSLKDEIWDEAGNKHGVKDIDDVFKIAYFVTVKAGGKQ